MDSLFGNEFMNLTLMDELQDRGTIKVTRIESLSSASQCTEASFSSSVRPSPASASSSSHGSLDTDILSSPESLNSTSSRSAWPVSFHVPQFSYDSEFKLQRGNAAHKENGTLLIPDPKLRSNILEVLVQEIVKYKLYCTGQEFNMVAKALISKHPCFTERGSLTGCAG